MTDSGSISWLETLVNRYFSMDPELADRLAAFDGKVIAIEILGFDRVLYLLPVQSRLTIRQNYDGEPDTVLKGTPSALFKMGLSENVAPLMLSGEIEISGDVRLGREFKKMLADMDLDWEALLSKFLGDTGAHQLVMFAKKLTAWGLNAAESTSSDISEYLQEESRDVVSAPELDAFYQDVDSLRNDVDRLQARIDALSRIKHQA